jgi:peptide deformylase
MAVREISVYPQNKAELRRQSKPVSEFGRQVRRLIRDLKDTLRASSDGVGLAAPQINTHLRVVVVCLGSEMDGEWQAGPPVALVNPQVVEASDERKDFDGCLSFPGLYEDGQSLDQIFEGFNAVVVHHEIDHLDGVLFIDRIEKLEDLYRLSTNEDGELVRSQVSTGLK